MAHTHTHTHNEEFLWYGKKVQVKLSLRITKYHAVKVYSLLN
jgi:hypothetical protein